MLGRLRDSVARGRRGSSEIPRCSSSPRGEDAFAEVQKRFESSMSERARWSRARNAAYEMTHSLLFEASMGVLIIVNMIFVIIEVNLNAAEAEAPKWLTYSNLVVLAIYFLDLCIKLFALRKDFIYDAFAMLDLLVVAVDIVVTLIISFMPVSLLPVALARCARILKITRALRALTMFPELNVLIKGLLFASKTVFWGVVLLVMAICFWSIVAVLWIQPIVKDLEREGYWAALDCERCTRAFSSVELSMLTFCQQLIVGEGWSEINTPIIEKRPETAIFFMSVMVSLMLAALNLLLGTIVERATEAKLSTTKELASKKDKEREEASTRLYEICKKLDEDQSGHLTLEELKKGYREEAEFQDLLTTMDIDERDLDVVFSMLDTDGSGDVEYKEFVDQLHMLKSQESNTLLCFIKFYVMEILAKVNRGFKQQKSLAELPIVGESRAASPEKSMTPQELRPAQEGLLLTAPPTWPEFDTELKKLADIRVEALKFSQAQAKQLDALQARLVETLRTKAPADKRLTPAEDPPNWGLSKDGLIPARGSNDVDFGGGGRISGSEGDRDCSVNGAAADPAIRSEVSFAELDSGPPSGATWLRAC